MVSSKLFVVTVALLVAVSVAQDDKDDVKCLDVKFEYPAFAMKASNECLEENKDKDAEENYFCLEACKMKKFGVLTSEADGKFDTKKFDDILVKLPKVARDGISADAKECFKNVGALDSKDNCKSHQGYTMCLLKSFSKHCKLDEE